MTPIGSPRPVSTQKPAVLLDTDVDSWYPSTPPLSTSGSTVGSPRNYEALQTPMNPMFSGIDDEDMIKKEHAEISMLDWSSCGSPPMTPVYLSSQVQARLLALLRALLSRPRPHPTLAPLPLSKSSTLAASAILATSPFLAVPTPPWLLRLPLSSSNSPKLKLASRTRRSTSTLRSLTASPRSRT